MRFLCAHYHNSYNSILMDYIHAWKDPDDRSEPNSPLILIPIFFNIERVLKKLTSINPPIAPIRDAGNGNNKAAMNHMAMYMYSLSNECDCCARAISSHV
jgi:hypothetical protein